MSTQFLVQINDFFKKYKRVIISIERLEISTGITLLIGENGSGKSTILKAISGLIQYEGEIISDCKVSYMSEFSSFPYDVSVFDFLSIINKLHRGNHEKMMELLLFFTLDDKLLEPLSSLSKGMKAKVNLIQCLMYDADLYLLDEPFSGLDQDSVEKLLEYVKNSEKSFLISSHYIGVFQKLGGNVVNL